MSDPPNKPAPSLAIWIFVGLAPLMAFVFLQRADGAMAVYVPYSQFKTLLEQG